MSLRVIFTGVGILACSAAFADDDCQRKADIVLEMVAAKPAIAAYVEARNEYPHVEAWQHQIFLIGESLTQLGVSGEKQEEMAKSIRDINYSSNPEVEVNIFEEYFYLTCRMEQRGEAYLPLRDISGEALIHCWDTVGSRKEFQECLTPLLQSSVDEPDPE